MGYQTAKDRVRLTTTGKSQDPHSHPAGHPHRIGAAAAKKRSNRSSGDGRDGEAQDLRGAGAGRRRILPHRRLWYPFFPVAASARILQPLLSTV